MRQRAERLMLMKTTPLEKLDRKLFAKGVVPAVSPCPKLSHGLVTMKSSVCAHDLPTPRTSSVCRHARLGSLLPAHINKLRNACCWAVCVCGGLPRKDYGRHYLLVNATNVYVQGCIDSDGSNLSPVALNGAAVWTMEWMPYIALGSSCSMLAYSATHAAVLYVICGPIQQAEICAMHACLATHDLCIVMYSACTATAGWVKTVLYRAAGGCWRQVKAWLCDSAES